MKFPGRHEMILACLSATALGAAVTLNGTARNVTTGHPASGDEVILLSTSGGGAEVGRGRTDTSGRFQFAIPEKQACSVRIIHQGVAYEIPVPPGLSPMEVPVYDVVKDLAGVAATTGVQRYETDGDILRVVEQVVVRNASNPPRTLLNKRPFEFHLPAGAEVDSGMMQKAGEQARTHKPTRDSETGRYQFPVFPLRPGETRFALSYRLSYKGDLVIEPRILYPLAQFAVVLPQSMVFTARKGAIFRPMRGKRDVKVNVTRAVKPGDTVAFRVSGMGALAEVPGSPDRAGSSERTGKTRPAAVPIRATAISANSMQKHVVGGFALILIAAAAGLLSHRRRQRLVSTRPGGRTRAISERLTKYQVS